MGGASAASEASLRLGASGDKRIMGITLSDCMHQQRQEALGPVNKWYCSQYFGYEVNNPELLLAYYIKHGGALNFRRDHIIESGPEIRTASQKA